MNDERQPTVVSCDLQIEVVCNFIKAYEAEKYRIMNEGGKLLSPICFMLDYCTEIRSKSN